MRTFVYESDVWLPEKIDKVFAFFSDAGNLQVLTPAWLSFQVLTPAPIPMHAGALIEYRLRLRGVPIRWRTRISAWDPPHRFVDEQLRGPYRLWVHEHRFESERGGTCCRDRVEYAVWGGALVNRLLVAADLRRIFAFRSAKLLELFPPGRMTANAHV